VKALIDSYIVSPKQSSGRFSRLKHGRTPCTTFLLADPLAWVGVEDTS